MAPAGRPVADRRVPVGVLSEPLLSGRALRRAWSGDFPLLVGAAGAGPEFDGGVVGFLVAVDVQAFTVDLQGACAGDGPVLAGAAVAAGDGDGRVVNSGVAGTAGGAVGGAAYPAQLLTESERTCPY